jgi:hypothetical protein
MQRIADVPSSSNFAYACSIGTVTIHPTPYLSSSIPKQGEPEVLVIGMRTWRASAAR